jgi:multidrug resistance protein
MSSATTKEDLDHIVGWDGFNDTENPRNWKNWTKTAQVLCVSSFTLYSNLASVMFAPGAPSLVADFHIASSMVASLTVSIYILGFVFGPFFLASLSEIYGRLRLYHICNAVYLAFTIGCALSTNTVMFLVFRFLCGCAASGPMTIGGGTIADLYEAEGRGKAMALFGLGPLLGPVIGPVIGGFVTQHLGWRWTFWLMVIMVSVSSLLRLHQRLNPSNEAVQ